MFFFFFTWIVLNFKVSTNNKCKNVIMVRGKRWILNTCNLFYLQLASAIAPQRSVLKNSVLKESGTGDFICSKNPRALLHMLKTGDENSNFLYLWGKLFFSNNDIMHLWCFCTEIEKNLKETLSAVSVTCTDWKGFYRNDAKFMKERSIRCIHFWP